MSNSTIPWTFIDGMYPKNYIVASSCTPHHCRTRVALTLVSCGGVFHGEGEISEQGWEKIEGILGGDPFPLLGLRENKVDTGPR